jgi:ribosome-associated protein
MVRKSRRKFYVDGELVAEAKDGDRRSGHGSQDSETPSRTRRKNESEELQKIGEKLVTLRMDSIAELSLPERLEDAIRDAKRISNFGGRRRLLQFIGKLMRQLDKQTLDAVRTALRAEHRG